MGLFSFLKKGKKSNDSPEPIVTLIVQVAGHEYEQFASAWKRELDERAQVELFAEYATLLINIADRLALNTYGNSRRTTLMAQVFSGVRLAFSRQTVVGGSHEGAASYLDRLFATRSEEYADCKNILGGEESLVFKAAVRICTLFNSKLSRNELSMAVADTGRVLTNSVVALMTTKPFKDLSS